MIKILSLIIPVTILISCRQEPAPDANVIAEQPSSSGKTLIAEGLRSEALLIFPEDDERWMGKIDQKFLVNSIFDAIYEGRVKPYDFITGDTISIDDVKAIESYIDTIYTEDLDEPDKVEMKIVEEGLRRDEITKAFLKEDWYFDAVNFKMEKRVIGISLAIENYDERGNMRGYQPLFIVYFDERYPLQNEDIP